MEHVIKQNNAIDIFMFTFKKIENFETIFLLTMMTLVKGKSPGNQRPNSKDVKNIDMQSSQLV